MQNERKKLEELNLLDDFLFNAMMTYPEMGEVLRLMRQRIRLSMIWNRIRMIRQSMLLHFHRESVFIMQLLTAVA